MTLLAKITEDLPANPVDAVSVLISRIDDEVFQTSEHAGDALDYRSLAKFVRRFCERFDLPVAFAGISASGRDLDDPDAAYKWLEDHVEKLSKFEADLEDRKAESEIEDLLSKYETSVSTDVFGLAKLNEEEKKKAHIHLQKIRGIIEGSGLSDRKKNALFDRINALAQEVDAHGTRTDRFFAFAGDVGFVLGDMAKKSKPLLQEVKEVLRIVSRSRARQEGVSLPPGDEVVQLAAPDPDVS